MNNHLSLVTLAALALLTPSIANAVEPVPGDSCTAGQENYFQRTGGNEIPTGHFMVCKSGTWRSILSWDAAAAITKIGNLSCTNGQILKFNGTTWGCSADNGGTLPALTSAYIWVGNGSNAATAVAMSGDATLSNSGVLTIANNAISSAEITDGTIANADLAGSIALSKLSVTGTANSSAFLRGDGTWATITGGGSGGLGGELFTASGTFTVPDGIKSLKVSLIGGGGSGGRCNNGDWAGGGGAGGKTVGWVAVTPGEAITVTVGEGGAARTSVGNGYDGSASSFEALTANGGKKGVGSSGTCADPAGGAGGTASGGTFNISGKKGANSTANGSSGGDAPQIIEGATYGDGSVGTRVSGGPTAAAAKDGMVLIEW